MRSFLIGMASFAVASVLPVAAAADEAPDALSLSVGRSISKAWLTEMAAQQPPPMPAGQAAQTGAGPQIERFGVGAVVGLSDVEIGPSVRYWVTSRVGLQANLGFSGEDFFPENVTFTRLEPTVIVAFGDFGEGAINMRPYAGAGLRVAWAGGGGMSDSQVRPVGVGGVEFGFQRAPRFKISPEISFSPDINADLDPLFGGPRLNGLRLAAMAHYFF